MYILWVIRRLLFKLANLEKQGFLIQFCLANDYDNLLVLSFQIWYINISIKDLTSTMMCTGMFCFWKKSCLVFSVPHHHQMSLPSSRGTSKMLSDTWTIHLDTICDGGNERHFNHAAKQHSFSYISIISHWEFKFYL